MLLCSFFSGLTLSGGAHMHKNRFFKKFHGLFFVSIFLFSLTGWAGTSTDPNLGISITAANNPVLVTENIEYSIVVDNHGDAGAIETTVTTTIPSSVNYTFGGSGWTCSRSSDTVTCTYGSVLDAGATANTLSLTRETAAAGSVTQDVTASSTNADADTSDNSASITVDVGQTNLVLSKTASSADVQAGENFNYTFTVTNQTSGTTLGATGIVITDTIPTDFTITSLPSECSASGQDITCNIASLAPDATSSMVIGVQAPSSVPASNPVPNTATLDRSGYSSATNKNGLPLSSTANVNVTAADVVVSLAASPSPVAISDTLTYTVTASNLNGVSADNVEVQVTLDSDLSYQSASGTDWSCSQSSNVVTCTLTPALQNGTDKSFTITAATPSTHQTVTTTAQISTTTTETDTGNNSASLDTSVEGADLRIAKTGPDSAAVLTDITYTVTVYNDGIADAANVVVTDTLPSGMSYKSDTAPNGCSQSGQTLTCSLNTLPKTSNTSFTVTATTPNATGSIVNNVSVTTDTDQNNNSDLSASKTTTLITPNLDIAKSNTPTEVGIGGSFTYTISVTNSQNAVAQDATITDTLPAGVTVTGIADNTDGWSCDSFPITGDGSASFTCTLSSFAANGSSTIKFNATAPNSTGTYQNRARISHSLNSNDGEDTSDLTVTGVQLDVTKSASATANAGGTIDYQIQITNSSQTDADTLTLTDDLSARLGAGYTINTVTDPDGWSCSGTTSLTCTRSTLAAGGTSSTVKFSVNVPVNATLGTVTNNANVHVDSPQSLDFASNDASTIIQGADIVITKSGDTVGIANETVNVNVIVTNSGNAVAKDVNVTIDLNTNGIADFSNIETDCGTGTFSAVTEPFTCQLGDLAQNGSKTVQVRATAPNYDSNFPGNSDIANSATAVTSTSQSNTANDTRTWNLNIHGADLIVDKVPSANEVAVGDTITYTISLRNQGDAVAKNIVLDDSVVETTDGLSLSNLSYSSADWSCTTNYPTGFQCTYKKDLASGQSTSDITVDATAPNSTTSLDQQRSNKVDVSNDTAESDTATTNSKVAPVTIRGAALTIDKSVTPNPARLQEQVTFTIRVDNSGLADADNVEVSDTLPNGFTAISTSGCDNDGSAVSGQSVTCQLGTIANTSGTKTFTITANAPNANGNYTNTATVTTSTPEADTSDNSDDAVLSVEGADLVPYKAAPARVAGNSEFQYTISLTNIGRSSAYGAEINDTIPTNNGTAYVTGSLTTVNGDWTCTLTGGTIHCQTNDPNFEIASGYNENIATFRVKAGPAHYFINNTVVTATDTSEANLANNDYTATTEVIDIDLLAQKLINGVYYGAGENYASIGETITYTLRIANISPVNLDITDANVTDLIPNNVTGVSVTPAANFTCNNPSTPGSTLFCSMNSGVVLAQNQARDVATITVTVIDAANFDINDENNNFVINRYKAETSLSDQDLGNNAPTGGDGYLHTNTLVRGANMSVDKTGPAQAGANQNFTYTLNIRNYPRPDTYTGTPPAHDVPSTDASGITVTDTLPSGVTFVSANGTNWSCSQSTGIVTCSYSGSLAPSNTPSTIDITVTAPNATGITLTNEANVTASTPELVRLLPDNRDTLDTDITGTDIVVTKTGTATAGMGDELTYTISVENNSTVPAAGVHVDDILHTDVNLAANWNRDLSGSGWTCVDNSASPEHNVSCDYTSGDLAPGSSAQFTIYTIAPNYTGTIRNRAVATTTTAESSQPNISDFDTVIEGSEIDFANDPFEQSPTPVGALRQIDYNITIINRGESEGRDINLTMQFPTGFSPEFELLSTGGDSGWSCDPFDTANVRLICHLPTLAPNNATSRLEVHAVAPNANQDVTYTIGVIGADAEGNTTTAVITPTTTVKGADLRVKKYVQDLAFPGYDDSNVTVGMAKYAEYNITVENLEIGLAKDINLTDLFDASLSDLTIQSQSGWTGCSINSNRLTCTDNGMLNSEGRNEVVVRAKTPSVEGRIDNSADVVTSTLETDLSNNSDGAYIIVEGSRFSVDINASKTPLAFDEIFDYEISIVNTGKNEADDINVTDTLPAGFTFTGNTGSDSGWSCIASDANRTVVCSLANLAGYNGSTKLVLNTKAPRKIGSYTNEINVTSPSIPAPVIASADAVEVRGADLEIALTPAKTEVLEEHNTTVAIVVKNIDISTAHDVNLTQTFTSTPAGTFVAADDTNCTVSAATVTCHWNTLAPDENRTITVTLTTPDITSDTTLQMQASSVTATEEPDTSNNSATASIDVKVIKAIADWRMDECNWGTVTDQTGNHNGTARNGAHTVNEILTKDSRGKVSFRRAGQFDGSNDYISIPNSTEINTATHNKRTIALWFNAKNTSGTHVLYEEGGSARGFAIYIKDGTLYVGGWNRPESGWSGTYLSTAIPAGEWHHVTLVLDAEAGSYALQADAFRGYLDGVRFASGTGTQLWGHGDAIGIGAVNGGTRLHDGTTGGGRYFNGFIDEVKLFNIALDDTAVETLYSRENRYINYDGTLRAPSAACQVNAAITLSAPASVPVESSFQYTITVNNLTLEPIEDLNLTVALPSNVTYVEDNISSTWNRGCTFDGTSSIYTCRFSDEGNLSNAWFYNELETIRLTVTAPNLITTLETNASIDTSPVDYDTSDNKAAVTTDTIGTNLRITKSVDLTTPALNAPFVYTISVTNDSSVDATDINVTDNVPADLSISSTIHDQWDSFNYDNNHVVAHVASIAAGETKYFTLTVSTGNSGTVINSASVTAHTVETTYSDNNDSVSVDVGGIEGNTTVILKDGFSQRKKEIYYGDLVAIGDSYLTGDDSNSSALLADINVSTSSPSTAGLELPYDNNITVTYARLYWTGHLHGEAGNASSVETNDNYKNITFVTPNGDYAILADENSTYYYYNKTQYDTYRRIYACSADVTDKLQEVYNNIYTYNGTYGVKDLKANTGVDDSIFMTVTDGNTTSYQSIKIGHFGGWSLVVFYEVNHRAHRDQVYKNINLFDGFKKLVPAAVGYEQLRIPIDGFLTPYAGETIDSRLMLFAGGGERARAVDYLSIVKTENNVSSDVNISDALNPENNILNGTITRAGAAITPRSPALDYSMGIDMDEFDISSDFTSGGTVYLGHLQGETNVTLSVGRERVGSEELFDQSFPSAIGLSTEIFNPDFIDSFKECFVEEAATGNYIPCKDTNVTRGGEIIYRITIVNTGNTDATKVFFEDPLPAEVDFNLSSADLKVVSITEKICSYLDGTNENNKNCMDWMIAHNYFSKSNGLTDAGKEFISTLDVNASNNQLRVWDAGFPDSAVNVTEMTNQQMLDAGYTTTSYPNNDDVNRTLLNISLHNRLNYNDSSISGTFPALNVSWVEFKVKVNSFAQLNKTFVNKAIINFTNPTLEAFGYDTNQSQESASADSPPVTFEWTALQSDISDPGRVSVGTKIVNNKFDLNISIDDSNSTFGQFVENYHDVNLTIWRIKLVDAENGYADLIDFNRSDFTIATDEYLPISNNMSWLIDRNLSLDSAHRNIWFSIQYKVMYKDTTNPLGVSTQLSPEYYGPFGDNFATRPEKFVFSATNSIGTTPSGEYLLIKSGVPFNLDINATNGLGNTATPYYTVILSGSDINDSNNSYSTVAVTDIKGCVPDITSQIHLDDFNFTDGVANTLQNVKFEDVGYITIDLRDTNWTFVDKVNNDCNQTINNDDNNQSDRFVSCYVQGNAKILFVPFEINITTETENMGNGFTYMANEREEMHATIDANITSYNADGNVTRAFDAACYANDVNATIEANITSSEPMDDLRIHWSRENNTTGLLYGTGVLGIQNFTDLVDDSNFTAGIAKHVRYWVDINRSINIEHSPVNFDTKESKASVKDYLGVPAADFENNTTLNADGPIRFWYARLHTPDYRSETKTIDTPIYIEVYCNSKTTSCLEYGIVNLPESSDDVNWWVNRLHTDTSGDLGILIDINATQNGILDPQIDINGSGNAINDLNASFTNGRYTTTVTYNGSTKLYKTKINTNPTAWLRYNRFFLDGRTGYNVEFNLPADDWSGIGTTGETVETNGSAKSNRRLEW